ncbi:hypothetical protein ABXS75_07450 [Roseburia hominis]
MDQRYWEQFAKTGKVEDYLFYKGMEICQNIMKKYGDECSESVDNGDGNGAVGITDWRI